jgi:hypothetical protein
VLSFVKVSVLALPKEMFREQLPTLVNGAHRLAPPCAR